MALVRNADMLVHDVLARNRSDRKRVARLCWLTGAPDESGAAAARERTLQAGNALLRPRIPVGLGFDLPEDSALAHGIRTQLKALAKKKTRKT